MLAEAAIGSSHDSWTKKVAGLHVKIALQGRCIALPLGESPGALSDWQVRALPTAFGLDGARSVCAEPPAARR